MAFAHFPSPSCFVSFRVLHLFALVFEWIHKLLPCAFVWQFAAFQLLNDVISGTFPRVVPTKIDHFVVRFRVSDSDRHYRCRLIVLSWHWSTPFIDGSSTSYIRSIVGIDSNTRWAGVNCPLHWFWNFLQEIIDVSSCATISEIEIIIYFSVTLLTNFGGVVISPDLKTNSMRENAWVLLCEKCSCITYLYFNTMEYLLA